jgi:hypothetical protein
VIRRTSRGVFDEGPCDPDPWAPYGIIQGLGGEYVQPIDEPDRKVRSREASRRYRAKQRETPNEPG